MELEVLTVSTQPAFHRQPAFLEAGVPLPFLDPSESSSRLTGNGKFSLTLQESRVGIDELLRLRRESRQQRHEGTGARVASVTTTPFPASCSASKDQHCPVSTHIDIAHTDTARHDGDWLLDEVEMKRETGV